MKFRRPILLKNATIFDGKGSAPSRGDLLIDRGCVHYSPFIELPRGGDEIDLDGLCVSPGWIDLHTHVFEDYGIFSVSPSDIGLCHGVTTLVDAGSAGALNYSLFSKSVINTARETILAYVNIASPGIVHGHATRQGYVADHVHPSLHSTELAKSLLGPFGDSIIGWKARLTAVLANDDPQLERHAFRRLLELRDDTTLPVMVHHVISSISSDDLLNSLAGRDVYTHLYHGVQSSIFDEKSGRPLDAARDARQRGVIFDVGHGSGSFRWACAERACQEHDFWPDTISSDLHRYNRFWPVRDLAMTMSKFLYLGATIEAIVAMVTGNAAKAMGRSIGTLTTTPSNISTDLTIFTMEKGRFALPDSDGTVRHGQERFVPMAVIKQGDVSPCAGFLTREDTSDRFARSLQAAAAH